MTRLIAMALVSLAVLCPASAWSHVRKPAGIHAAFVAPNGSAIELDMLAGTIRLPHSQHRKLFDCGDKSHTCLSDHDGFAFSFAHECQDVGTDGDTTKSKLIPKIVSVLHGNLWVVFDASPNYLFHYVIPKGIVGIYIGSTPSFDFRSLFHDRNLQIDKLDATEYHITAHSDPIAACSEQ